MTEVAQFVAVDILTHAAIYLRKQSCWGWAPYFIPNCQAQMILYESISKVLDEVDDLTAEAK